MTSGGSARSVRARIRPIDWVMLLLALVSIGMIAYETWGPVTPEQSRQLLLADLVICGIFALEFVACWVRDERPKTFPLRNWYEILGMIPASAPALRGFRLFRLIRIVVILARFGRAADRAFGEGFTRRILAKFKATIVEVIGDALTVKVLDESMSVIQKGTFAKNLADAMERHGPEMQAIVVEKVKADPEIGAVKHLPGFDLMVATSSKVTQRILIDLLRDPRMDQLIKDIIKQNVEQIRAAVKERETRSRTAATAAP